MFGVIMKAYRARKGWSQEELAEKLHMSRSAISKIENDQQVFDVQTLHKLMQLSGDPGIAISILCGMEGIKTLLTLVGG